MVSRRLSSSVNTCPVILARIVRASSRSAIWKYVLRRSMTGKYAVAFPYDTEKLSRTNHPWARWEWTNS